MKKIKTIFVNISLIFTSAIVALLFVEIVLRAVSPYPFFSKSYPSGIVDYNMFKTSISSVFDPILGWYPRAFHHSAHPNFGNENKTHFIDGIRSNQLHPADFDSSKAYPPPFVSARSILAVGDSFTEGSQVGNDKTWPAFLEIISGNRVINAGVGGYGLDQSYLRAAMLLKKHKVRHLIISFIPDDLQRTELSARSGAFKPYFTYSNGSMELHSDHVIPPVFMDPKAAENLKGYYGLFAHSFLAIKIMETFSMEIFSHRPDWLIQFGGSKTEHENGGLVGCGIMKKAKELEELYPVKVWILVQYPDYFFPGNEGDIEQKWLNNYFSKTLETKKCALAQNLNVIDMFDPLNDLYKNNPTQFNKLYVRKNAHMSGTGNRFVAMHVADVMNGRENKERNLGSSVKN